MKRPHTGPSVSQTHINEPIFNISHKHFLKAFHWFILKGLLNTVYDEFIHSHVFHVTQITPVFPALKISCEVKRSNRLWSDSGTGVWMSEDHMGLSLTLHQNPFFLILFTFSFSFSHVLSPSDWQCDSHQFCLQVIVYRMSCWPRIFLLISAKATENTNAFSSERPA